MLTRLSAFLLLYLWITLTRLFLQAAQHFGQLLCLLLLLLLLELALMEQLLQAHYFTLPIFVCGEVWTVLRCGKLRNEVTVIGRAGNLFISTARVVCRSMILSGHASVHRPRRGRFSGLLSEGRSRVSHHEDCLGLDNVGAEAGRDWGNHVVELVASILHNEVFVLGHHSSQTLLEGHR